MYPEAFKLVSTDDTSKVVAFGMEIRLGGGEIEATITYRHEPGGRGMFGVHESARKAQDLFSRLTPTTLVWAADELPLT